LSPLGEIHAPDLRAVDTPMPSAVELSVALQLLTDAINRHDLQLLLRGVWSLVPEYHPSSVITAGFKEEPVLELASEMQA
jgi:hypothetical protein